MAARPSRRRPAPEPGAVEDPLAADKRTLAIGLAAMVAFVAIGVVSAQLFVTGGCEPLGEPRAATAGTEAVDQLLSSEAVAELEQLLDVQLTSASVVAGDADRLIAGGGGPVHVVGDVVTVLDDDLVPDLEVEVPGVVVGDGPTLFDVALANELTGQVDAFTPLDPTTLEAGACTDTTVVGEQFAFLLDAGDGQLLQLRIDEDGDLPRAELRDRDGRVSRVDLDLPAGPAGVLGERVTGRTDGEVVVVGRRVTADDPGAALIVADAASGERTAEVSRDELADLVAREDGVLDLDGPIDGGLPLRVEVLAVTAERAWLSVRPDPAQEELPTTSTLLVEVTFDGDEVELTAHGEVGDDPARTAVGPEGTVAVATDGERSTVGALVLIDADGRFVPLAVARGEVRSLRWSGRWPLLVTDDAMVLVGEPIARLDGPAADVRDVVVTDDGRVLVLVRAAGRSAVLVGEPT